ncbi:RidA family protein [Pedobacter heparinus]|uniref:RidA family protein n=1 Tax=Pedobacter heparinus TaxID=984 RepID=UPI00292EB52D|nr:RidA family protein [Pedobacter heparinus]
MMKKVLLMLFLSSGYFPGFAQNNRSSSVNPNKPLAIKYIGAAKATGGSLAVVVNELPLAHTSQFLPLNKNGVLVGKNDLDKQMNQVFENVSLALKAAGSNSEQLVKINICIAQPELLVKVKENLNTRFKTGKKPAISFVSGDLIHPDALVGMDVIAVAASAADKKVKYLKPENLAGPKQQAQVAVLPAGGVVYVSGQAAKGKMAEATRETLKQLGATLVHLGLDKSDIVQIKSFICPASDIRIVEQEMATFFAGHTIPPTVYVDWLSNDPVIEIELIAASPSPQKPAAQMDFITPPGMTASPVYSKVTRVNYGKKVYFSSMYGESSGDAKTEVAGIFTEMGQIAKQAGTDFSHLAKATYYVANDSTSNELNTIRPKYYKADRPPAASKAKVKGVGLTGKGICIDMIGVCF